MRRRGLAAAVMGMALGGTAVAQAAPAPLRWQPEKGKEAAYDVSVEMTVRQQEGDAEGRSLEMRQRARVSLTVEEMGDDGSAALAGRLSGVSLMWKDGDVAASWEEGGAEPSTDAERALAAIGRAAMQDPLRVTIDAAGMLTGMSGFDSARAALDGQVVLDEGALGMFEPVALASRLAPVFQGDAGGAGEHVAGAGARRVGNGWQTTERVSLGSAGALEVTTDWVLKEVLDGVARIEGVSRVEALKPEEPSPGAPVVRVERGAGATTTIWDLSSAAMQSCETEQTLTMVWTLGDLTLRQEQTSKSSVRRAE